MGVPITVTSIRQQIVEALKLSLDSVGTIADLDRDYAYFTDSSKYPIIKVFSGNSQVTQRFFNRSELRTDEFMVIVAPWCNEANYQLETSEVMETFGSYLNTETVRTLMYSTYQDRLSDIRMRSAELLKTDINNPSAFVKFTLDVQYKLGV